MRIGNIRQLAKMLQSVGINSFGANMIQIFRDTQDLGGDEDEGRGGTLRRLLNRGNEAIAQRRTGRRPTATVPEILRESAVGRIVNRARGALRRRRG
jgi:hypothetical protein